MDYSELKKLAEASVGFTDVSLAPDLILDLLAENEGLRKDAERWRYARDRLQRFSLTAKPQHESVAIGHDKWIDSRMELEALSAQLK